MSYLLIDYALLPAVVEVHDIYTYRSNSEDTTIHDTASFLDVKARLPQLLLAFSDVLAQGNSRQCYRLATQYSVLKRQAVGYGLALVDGALDVGVGVRYGIVNVHV